MPKRKALTNALGQNGQFGPRTGRGIGRNKLFGLSGHEVLVVPASKNCFKHIPHRTNLPKGDQLFRVGPATAPRAGKHDTRPGAGRPFRGKSFQRNDLRNKRGHRRFAKPPIMPFAQNLSSAGWLCQPGMTYDLRRLAEPAHGQNQPKDNPHCNYGFSTHFGGYIMDPIHFEHVCECAQLGQTGSAE